MQWRNTGESSNIEDRRGMSGRGIALGGGGIGTLLLVVVLWLCGVDSSTLMSILNGGGSSEPAVQTQPQSQANPQNNDEDKKFVASVLKTTENAWNEILPKQAGIRYREPKLVLFTDQVRSACGVAGSSTGPFYCPGDEQLYLDYGFFRELKNEFRAPGDFAQAYVIAHEVGHHVQNMLGKMDNGGSNQASIRIELQADCYAGIWGNYVQRKGLLEVGDVEEAIRAAQAVGDDSIQKRSQGYVVPDSFTHGSSEQRMAWFTRGFQSGDMRQCDTSGRR
ncbi:MAG: KPN_02809 family neutral zinc metallopeptidase [Pyrinomonadaceae bacterium]